MYLVDTNVLSADAPTKAVANHEVKAWLRKAADKLFLSSVTIAEIERGIAASLRTEATTTAERLRLWLSAVEHLYGDRILPFDVAAARAAGPMMDQARAYGMGFGDIAIAATAGIRDLTILTANERHFEPLGVRFVNPFKALPPL